MLNTNLWAGDWKLWFLLAPVRGPLQNDLPSISVITVPFQLNLMFWLQSKILPLLLEYTTWIPISCEISREWLRYRHMTMMFVFSSAYLDVFFDIFCLPFLLVQVCGVHCYYFNYPVVVFLHLLSAVRIQCSYNSSLETMSAKTC